MSSGEDSFFTSLKSYIQTGDTELLQWEYMLMTGEEVLTFEVR